MPINIQIDQDLERNMPIGWFFSYNNSFHELKPNKLESYKRQPRDSSRPVPQPPPNNRRGAPPPKRAPLSQNLLKLFKKY